MKLFFQYLTFALFILIFSNQSKLLAEKPKIDSLRPRYGIFLDGSYNMHSVNFKQLVSDPPNTPYQFESGTGFGMSLGGLYEFWLSDKISLNLRASMLNYSGTLLANEPLAVRNRADSSVVLGTSEHSIVAKISALVFEPIFSYRFWKKVSFNMGLNIGVINTGTFDMKEMVVSPEGGTFYNLTDTTVKSRIRNQATGLTIPNLGLTASLLGGFSVELPMNRAKSVFIVPEIMYSFGMTKIESAVDKWQVNSLRGGIALKYSPIPTFDKPVLFDTLKVRDTTIQLVSYKSPERIFINNTTSSEKKSETEDVIYRTITIKESYIREVPKQLMPVTASVSAISVNPNGEEVQVVRVELNELVTAHLRPLLPFVFFDENSAELTKKYLLLRPEVINNFQEDGLYNMETFGLYYHLLNIIGRRLTNRPDATITLTGCNANYAEEAGNIALSKKRIEPLFNYLVDVWKIDPKRIKTEARNLPAKSTQSGEEKDFANSREENRRVEITSDDWEIIKPVFSYDTVYAPKIPFIRIKSAVKSDFEIKEWTIIAEQHGKKIKEFGGKGDVPPMLEWNLNENTLSPGAVTFTISVTNVENQKQSAKYSLTMVGVQIKRDKDYDKYNLILFDFNKSEISGANNKIATFIKKRLKPTSQVTITGFSDLMGREEYNHRLADSRAKTTAKTLNIPSSNASASKEPSGPYDNSLPEGRCFNRTVEVSVETPIE